ncbi:imidazole glycerol phosphate synthase subunit HisH [Daejeonella sp.]|uniref:imidazole glycerol phosphate synthase subunit HisH n=1 Tax=Daejeonella sp. TaxID=2805397 RepID=UPI0030BEC6B2
MTVVIVDYGMGNIRSIKSTLNYLGVQDVIVSFDPKVLKNGDKLILPGVGSFGKAIARIRERGLDVCLNELVVNGSKPILGICLGMQLMGISSNEDGINNGLGLVKGLVTKFDNTHLKIPHVGFNQVMINNKLKLYNGFEEEADFYFTHSYKMTSSYDISQCHCKYGDDFVASFENNNIAGVQYHPELSQNNGLHVFRNFLEKF